MIYGIGHNDIQIFLLLTNQPSFHNSSPFLSSSLSSFSFPTVISSFPLSFFFSVCPSSVPCTSQPSLCKAILGNVHLQGKALVHSLTESDAKGLCCAFGRVSLGAREPFLRQIGIIKTCHGVQKFYLALQYFHTQSSAMHRGNVLSDL